MSSPAISSELAIIMTETPTGIEFKAGQVTGRLNLQPRFALELTLPEMAPSTWFELEHLRYQTLEPTTAVSVEARFTPSFAYVQPPFGVVEFDVESHVGLMLSSYFRPVQDGFDLDVRVNLREPVDALELSWAGRWTKGTIRWEETLPGVDASASAGRCLGRWQGPETNWLVLLDLGETGTATMDGTAVDVRLFRQPLERGVILVGRLSLRRWPTTESALAETLLAWAEQPHSL